MLVGQGHVVPAVVVDPPPRRDRADPADIEDELPLADEQRLAAGRPASWSRGLGEEGPARRGLDPRGDRVVGRAPGRSPRAGRPRPGSRRRTSSGPPRVRARCRPARPKTTISPVPLPPSGVTRAESDFAPGKWATCKTRSLARGPRLKVRVKVVERPGGGIDAGHLEDRGIADRVRQDRAVAVMVEPPVVRPGAGQWSVGAAVAAAEPRDRRSGRPPGSPSPGRPGWPPGRGPTTRGWISCLPLKLIPFQSMNPSPVHDAASRSVSWS